jgi:membrane-bound inhibitor of C-type lysozyme
MIRSLFVAGLAVLTLAACEKTTEAPKPAPTPDNLAQSAPPATPAAPDARQIVYACADGSVLKATYPDDKTAVVEYGGKTRTLTVAMSASGARYVGDGLQWWTKGMTDGMVAPLKDGEDVASAKPVECMAPSDAGK